MGQARQIKRNDIGLYIKSLQPDFSSGEITMIRVWSVYDQNLRELNDLWSDFDETFVF